MARVLMKGCEAIAEAAVRAGCRFLQVIRLHRRMKYQNILRGDFRKSEVFSYRENQKWHLLTWYMELVPVVQDL